MNLNLPEKRSFIGPAHMWKRILAFVADLIILDFFIFGMFNNIFTDLVGVQDFSQAYALLSSNPGLTEAFLSVFLFMLLFGMAYFVLIEYLTGQTPGKMLMNIHVVSEKMISPKKIELTSPNLGQCIIRSFLFIPALPSLILWIFDPLFLIITKKNQRLTEWLSRTKVVEEILF